jgi:hypothetical protein
MASIRQAILDALVTRLAAIPGFVARLRDVENPEANAPIVATVYFVDENKEIANDRLYACEMQVGVELRARIEDAHPTTDGGNAFRYLDRLVVLVEKKVHESDTWGIDPDADVEVKGHDVGQVEGDPTSVEALILLTFEFRHDAGNPEVV